MGRVKRAALKPIDALRTAIALQPEDLRTQRGVVQ
jgi:hypothetical protein